MGFLSTSTNSKKRTIAIFDIGSGSVGGAILELPNASDKNPTILTSSRTDITVHNELTFKIFVEDMLSALSESAEAIHKSKAGAPEAIICSLASPWYISETRIVHMSREHSFIFTQKLADELLAKELSSLELLYKQKYGGTDSQSELIEHDIVGVSLNGYPVEDPIGKRTRSIELHMVVSLAPKICLDKIREELSKTFHHIPVHFASFMTMSYLSVREKYPDSDSYVLLDIGGEVTDVALVYKGILKASLSFPFGKNSFYKYISTKLDIEPRDAFELFRLYSANTLEANRRIKVEPLFKELTDSWNKSFRDCISTLPKTLTLPSTLFLTADPDIKQWFVNSISNEEYIQNLFANRSCHIISQDGPEYLSMCKVNSGQCDPFLMIESIAATKKLQH